MPDAMLGQSASDLGRAIGAGKIDPVDLAQAFFDAIGAHREADRIYARTTPERGLAEAAAARDRARLGLRRGLLDGVPISWKDLFDTAGTGTEAGSAFLAGRKPETDAVVLQKATFAGLVCLGKTHMTELAFSGLGYNPITATPPNANDPEAAPGGSSSGAAASVAFGLAAAGIGSDTGGSVRVPAAWNDLVGLKTTHGRLDLGGVVPLCESFDTVGPLTRTVEDAAQLLAVLEGGTAADLSATSLDGARFASLGTIALDDVRDRPRAAFEDAIERIRQAGARVEQIEVPEIERAFAHTGPLYAVEAYATWAKYIDSMPEKMFDRVRDRFLAGKSYSGTDYVCARQALRGLRRDYIGKTAEYDAVLMPTCPIMPPNLHRLMNDDAYFVRQNLLTLRNTRIGNLMGLCSLTLPTGTPGCGIMLNVAPMQEERLLRLGQAVAETLS
ncbi:MAG: amidase family protein [Pseudomonadota bacterium]